MKKYLMIFISLTFCCSNVFSQDLPEFFGVYIDSTKGLIEVPNAKNVYTTGWFTNAEQPKSNDLNSMQEYLSSGGDLGRALAGAQNIKSFLTDFSNIIVSPNDLKGFIIYGDFNIDSVNIYSLSNKVLPANVRFIEYKGPEPINKNKMYFLANAIDYKAKPLKDKMYYVKMSSSMTQGCYAITIGKSIYDFRINTGRDKSSILGLWNGYMEVKKNSFFSIPQKSRITVDIIKMNDDGTVDAEYKFFKRDTDEVLLSRKWGKKIALDIGTGIVEVTGFEEVPEHFVDGMWNGKLIINESDKCGCSSVSMSGNVSLFKKFLDDNTKDLIFYWYLEKNGE